MNEKIEKYFLNLNILKLNWKGLSVKICENNIFWIEYKVATTLGMMALSITTLSIITLSIINTQHY